jgi:hypothetical protein
VKIFPSSPLKFKTGALKFKNELRSEGKIFTFLKKIPAQKSAGSAINEDQKTLICLSFFFALVALSLPFQSGRGRARRIAISVGKMLTRISTLPCHFVLEPQLEAKVKSDIFL